MSKKQIIKNIKKNSNNNVQKEEKDGFYKFVTTVTIILLVLVGCYLLIGVFGTKEIDFGKNKKKDKDTKETTDNNVNIDNSTITAGQIFNQKEDEYYVVVYDVESELTNLSTFISSYKSSEGALSVYTVDSAKKFNSKYIVEKDSNTNPTGYSDLKMTSPTMIKVSNGSVSEYIEGEDSIKSILKK